MVYKEIKEELKKSVSSVKYFNKETFEVIVRDIKTAKEILESGGCVGRKLDFLVQELNREANTIGSKAQDAQMARIVVALKSNIEKIREQIQNLE